MVIFGGGAGESVVRSRARRRPEGPAPTIMIWWVGRYGLGGFCLMAKLGRV